MKNFKGRDDRKWKKSSNNKHGFNEMKTGSSEEMPKSILKKNKHFGNPIKNMNFVENSDQQINKDFTSKGQSEQMTSVIKKNKKTRNKKFQKMKKEVDVQSSEEAKQNESMELESSVGKSSKRKSDDFEDSADKKIKPCEMKFKKRKLMRKQQDDGAKYDFIKNLKTMWEDLRREDCNPEKKKVLLNQACVLLKGRVKEFAFAHDTVRVIECVLAEGSDEHRSLIFEELQLQDDIIRLAKSTYGKFAVLKMLKYCSKKQKEKIMTSFHGKVTKLMRHQEAAEVVETAFNEHANTTQRFELVQEFYGANYWHFKETNMHNLTEILKDKPEARDSVIKSMKEHLLKVLEKTVIKHSLIHHVLLQFFLNCDPASRSEIIESLKELVPEILHTKDGSRVAMHCVWHGNQKDRKTIIKHMKSFVKKIAMEEHGHMVLLALFDSVDDTTLIDKVIIKELQESLLEISENVHGKKVLIYLLNPRDPHFFHPDIINILKTGDKNESSKKDPEKRRLELNMFISKPLTQLIVENITELYKDNAFCLFAVTILKHAVGNKIEAYTAIAKLVAEPYTSENKNVHIIETPGSYFMLKQLLMNDVNGKKENPDTVTFSQVLVNTATDGVMKTWFKCNRGAFILVSLIETEIPAVVSRVKEELTGCKKQLGKFNFKGAEILLRKLKDPGM